jgi:hypothetical protein
MDSRGATKNALLPKLRAMPTEAAGDCRAGNAPQPSGLVALATAPRPRANGLGRGRRGALGESFCYVK